MLTSSMSAFHPLQTLESAVLQAALYAPHQPMGNRRHLPNLRPRIRRDGWTNGRRVTFFVTLAASGSVTFACASVGMSRKSAYALKKRDRTFASLWKRALAMAGKEGRTAHLSRAEGDNTAPAIGNVASSTGVKLAGKDRALAERERDRFFATLRKGSAHRIVADANRRDPLPSASNSPTLIVSKSA